VVRALFSLYIRAGASVANFALRIAVRGADLAAGAVRIAVPTSEQPVWAEPEASVVESEPAVSQTPEPTPRPRREVDYELPEAQPAGESGGRAKTIDDEAELVAEVAEPGAEDGASAQIEVDEPWKGYDDLAADDVIERIRLSDAAELAVVELYERSRKRRRTVLAAAERRQRELANAPS
jgi:hypothetical protein